jgi:biopolymer transport protein ExbB
MGDTSSLGFNHFIEQADIVAKVLLVVLAAMSAISWYLIVSKGISQVVRQKRSQKFLTFFWSATSLEEVQNELNVHGVQEPFGHLTAHSLHAQAHHAKFGAAKLEEAGGEQEFLTRTIKKVLDEETTSLENGLTMLATIGATAPFVGLFGTVWGVYHALVAIGMSGSGMLDKVAGPVGEALIMTGIGLAVALPAVMGYNWLTRANRVLTAKLDAFAFELLTFLSMGRALQATGRAGRPTGVPLAAVNY